MEVRLSRKGVSLAVGIVPDGDGFLVTVDGVTRHVCAPARRPSAAAAGATVDELALIVDGRPCRALVARTRERVLVGLGGRVWSFETGAAGRAGGEAGKRSGIVAAPMPGKIVAVLVAAGDRVEAGQPLVVLEAMKMESTLVAEVSGTVTRVATALGSTVDGGAVLVEIAPAEP